jgi:anaerobic ribonucleoside-triphosphate reductase
VKENLVSFIYTINQPTRGGIQSPFTNVSVYDDNFIEKMLPSYRLVEDEETTYEATKEIVKQLQVLFLDTMNEELSRTVFTFPVTTACFAIDENKEILDKQFLKMIAEKNRQFGFINIFAGKSSVLSSCCRLRSSTESRFFEQLKYYIITLSDESSFEIQLNETLMLKDDDGKEDAFYIDEIKDRFSIFTFKGQKIKSIVEKSKQVINSEREYHNSFGAGSSKIGSIGVATINLPRLGYKNIGDETKFFEELKSSAEDCCKINHAKRHIIQKRIDGLNAPLYNHGFIDLKKQYSTTGIIGLKECVEIMGYDILTEEGQQFVFKMLDVLNNVAERSERFTKYPHNLEQIPGESAAVKLAEKDKLLKYQNSEYNYAFYSNQFIPLIAKANLLDRIKLQGMFDSKFSGGAILHINVDSKICDSKKLENLITLAVNQGVVYFAINYAIKECEDGHINVVPGDTCDCGKPITAIYSRPVGYITCTKFWAKTKREDDFGNRKFYSDIAVNQ